MSKHLSIVEAKTHLSDCIREVERGESVLITRHGKPVAVLVPAGILGHVDRSLAFLNFGITRYSRIPANHSTYRNRSIRGLEQTID